MNKTKICGNCDHFISTKEFEGKCILVKDCIGENTYVYQWCKDFKPCTVTGLQREVFAETFENLEYDFVNGSKITTIPHDESNVIRSRDKEIKYE